MVLELPFNDAEDEASEWQRAVRLHRQRRAVRPRGLLDARSIPSYRGQGVDAAWRRRAVRSVEPAGMWRAVGRGLRAVLLRARGLRRMGQRRTPCRRSTPQGGDYAVATLLATQWGLAALNRLGDDVRREDLHRCAATAWRARTPPASSSTTARPPAPIHISPGDLDEGIKALLLLSAVTATSTGRGRGFDRFTRRANVPGVLRGQYGPTIAAYRGLGDDQGRVAALDADIARLATMRCSGRRRWSGSTSWWSPARR